MSIHAKLLHLFPDYADGDWELTKIRGEDRIAITAWNRQEPQPTQAQLDAVTDQQAADAAGNERIRRNFELSKKDKVLIRWIAQRTGGGNAQSIKAELKAIWDSIN